MHCDYNHSNYHLMRYIDREIKNIDRILDLYEFTYLDETIRAKI